MWHNFIDRYGDLESPIHRLDPRTKFVCLLLFVVLVVTTPADRLVCFGAYTFIIVAAIMLSRVPLQYVLKRVSLVLPFVLLTAVFLPFWKTSASGQPVESVQGFGMTRQGLMLVWNVTAKALLAAAAMVLLSSSTRFSSLLKGLESLRVPKVMLMILSFMYRYIFVATDQALRLERARESRYCGHNRIGQIRVLSNMVGLLFVRAYERAERVYQSMVSRGFDGEIRNIDQLRFSRADYLFIGLFLGSVLLVSITGRL